MEKYLIVTDKSDLHKQYWDYKNALSIARSEVKEFMLRHDIKAEQYGFGKDVLFIQPTEEDKENFKKNLCSPDSNGFCRFRSNSKIAKTWHSFLKENNIKSLSKPWVGLYFTLGGGVMRSRLFDVDGVVYCSSERQGDFGCPEGMIEIPASQFFKIIEDDEASHKVS